VGQWSVTVKPALVVLLVLAASPVLTAEDQAGNGSAYSARGPAEIRDGQLLAQSRLTLPAVAPQVAAPGRWEFHTSVLWSNTFSWTQDRAGETPVDRSFLLDGETATLDLLLRRGLTPTLDVGLRTTLHDRGGGSLDGFINAWHRLVNLPDGDRPDFRRDAFRVEGKTASGEAFSWNDNEGLGLGAFELESRWLVASSPGGPRTALIARVLLPAGTGPYAEGGFGAGVQVAVGVPLSDRVDLFTGLGVTAQDPGPVRRVGYEPARLHGYLAFEWRLARPLSAIVETNVASRLVSNIDEYPGTHWMINIGGRLDLGRRTRLDAFVTENILSQQSTTDFGLYFALSVLP
jgi:hypothetical protein